MASSKPAKKPGPKAPESAPSKIDLDSLSCSECGVRNCYRNDSQYPSFCLTVADPQGADESRELYQGQNEVARILKVAGDIESEFYQRMTRLEETITLAKRLGVKKLGIASCFALINESAILAKCVRSADIEPKTVICKIGSIDKGELGVPDEMKLLPGHKEANCNPVLQAMTLNDWGSEFNVVMGLCVGHDALFNMHSNAPVTTLVAKDRVLGHNPVQAIYLSKTFYARIMDFSKYPKSRLAKKEEPAPARKEPPKSPKKEEMKVPAKAPAKTAKKAEAKKAEPKKTEAKKAEAKKADAKKAGAKKAAKKSGKK
ncbi:MAG: DUF1847 domain-containing protein [Deltaproteobacteria bacterium]|jgi:uncharacterized metal-binding protein|nr:DUF1847 domain-containing protein [Deltaproteobacteria bacterium]